MFDVWARRAELHESPEITWSLCNGCKELLCKHHSEMKLEKNQWTYHCTALHDDLDRKRIYDMTEEKCPIHRGLGRR